MSKQVSNIVLATKNLSIGYATKKQTNAIASEINLEIPKGQLIALLGKNGIGKSSLLRTITNVQSALSGSVFLKGKDLISYDASELSKEMSLVLTERLPESQLTVFELVALGRQPYTNWVDTLSEIDLDKINIAMQQTEIEHLQNRRFYELSDGQLQRVLIARALAQDTDIIILDEPTTHLDLHHTASIFNLLRTLVNNTKKTILVSTHQLNLALQISDQQIVMLEKKVHFNTKKQLISNGIYDELFSDKIIKFDASSGQFLMNQ